MFEAAAAFVVAVATSTKLDDEQGLRLYGLYKQATEDACTTARPGFWDVKGRRKWYERGCAAWLVLLLQEVDANQAALIRSCS